MHMMSAPFGRAVSALFVLGLLLLNVGCGEPKIVIKDTVHYAEAGNSAGPQQEDQAVVPMNYLLGPGDELEVLYGIDPGVNVTDYLIEAEDTLRIDFYYYPTMNTTVRVRPDGRITAPLLGEMKVAGMRPQELAAKLEGLFRPHLSRPKITVDLLNFNIKVEELKKAITTQDRGQSRLVVVRPDGSISLPYIGDTKVAGMTAPAASEELQQRYRKYISNLSVTVAVLRARSYRYYIMGEVGRPNFYELLGLTSLTQAISIAGGFTRDANTHQVVVISRDNNGNPKAQVLDMDEVIGKGNIGADILLNQYDVVFVPKTKLSAAGLAGERLWQLIPISFSAGYAAGHTVFAPATTP